ncbi:MAG: CRISPR-associated helicase Cas3', partial [Anaerolineae bacterium]|nr:CRISPR-associated helicase Cas3' [Anaerolineae bacterium]
MSKYIKNPAHVPDFMKHIYAKSKDDEGYQQTLADHTWLVLCRLSDQVRLRGNLADQMGDERLWHRLYWGCFLHDFGKAAQGFQERLQKDPPENTWAKRRHRHEVLSLAFVDWLFPPRHPDRLPVICVIVSHHKDARQVDFNGILDKYGAGQRKEDQLARIEELIDEIDPVDAQHLWDWLRKFGMVWQEAMGFPILEEVQPRNFASFGSQAICRALDEFSALVNLADDDDLAPSDRMAAMLRRGLIFTADHSASAGTKKFPPMPLTRAIAHTPLQKFQPNAHQIAAENAPEGSTILIAPTGSGKTEAALLWAARQIEQRPSARLFYTLPYQASMNAMYERLGERFFGMRHEDLPRNEILTIQHSRALLKFYQDMMNDERTPREVAEQAKFLKNLAKLNFYPIQIFSPYQMLKAAYSLKGYEAQLVDYANGLFIFDEIHAYDPKRMALIITLMGWLAENLHARFLVMTATLPPMVKQALQHALSIPDSDIITASPADFEASQRHTVHLRAGELLNQIVP